MKAGIFGGTFNPPHNGHRSALESFISLTRPDIAIVTVTGTPPHKQLMRVVEDSRRLEMAKLAFGDIATVSDLEICRSGKSYTVDTLEYFSQKYSELSLYMGSDMLLGVENVWHRYEDIFKLCTVEAFSRTGEDYSRLCTHAEHLRQSYGAKVNVYKAKPFVVSSTQIREKLKNGDNCEALMPSAVAKYIKENGLYK